MINNYGNRCVYCNELKSEEEMFPLIGLSGEQDSKGRHIFGKSCRECYPIKKAEYDAKQRANPRNNNRSNTSGKKKLH